MEKLELVLKQEHSPHHSDRNMVVMVLPEAVPKLGRSLLVEMQATMEVPAVALKLDRNLSIRVNPPLDPVEDILS